MTNIAFRDLELREPEVEVTQVEINETTTLEIRKYLPIAQKIELINFIVNGALDDNTGCFSPIRTEVYTSLGVCRWYAGIEFTIDDLIDIERVYDTLEINGVLDVIYGNIPEDELEFMQSLITETINDISRYNSSAAGIINNMSVDASMLDGQLGDLLEKVKNAEGLDTLSVIKDMVGRD